MIGVVMGSVSLEETTAAIVLLVILGLLQTWTMHRQSKVKRTVEGIDRAVNNKPADQPKLYDLVQTLDMKVDAAVAMLNERSLQHDRRDDDRFDQVLDAVGRVDQRVDGQRRDFQREIRRLDRRISDHHLPLPSDPQPNVLEDGDTPYT